METPPRQRPPSPPRGRCLLGRELEIPFASPISCTRGMARYTGSDENSGSRSDRPYRPFSSHWRPRKVVFDDDDDDDDNDEQEGTPDPLPLRTPTKEQPEEPGQDARILSGVRRSMRIMQLQQKSGNVVEDKATTCPVAQAVLKEDKKSKNRLPTARPLPLRRKGASGGQKRPPAKQAEDANVSTPKPKRRKQQQL